ncbi:MAG: 50S ribosomal protein L9 [Myxococcota bacterium]
MKLILKEDVPNLGAAGELVAVKPGYARNYLLPQGKAIGATENRLRELEHHRRIIAEQVVAQRTRLEAERDRLEGVVLEITANVGEEGKLFGSVTSAQLAELLAEKGFRVDRRKIALAEPIKEAGEHEVGIRLHPELVAHVKVKVSAAE